QRRGAPGRLAKRETTDVGAVPHPLRHEIPAVDRVRHGRQVPGGGPAVGQLVLPALAGEYRPQPAVPGTAVRRPATTVHIGLAVVVVRIAVEVHVPAGRGHLHGRVAVERARGRRDGRGDHRVV